MKKYLLFIIFLIPLQSFSQTYSFTHNSIVRSYIVHLPTGYIASTQYPLVINMHGYTSTASQQQSYSQMNVVADTGKFIVVYPDGVSNAWNAGYGVNPTIDDVGFISALIDTMKNDFSINANKVFACGMSNGGFMSYRLACQLSNKIAAIASVTGLMSDSVRFFMCQNNCPVPVMDFHGTTDAVVNYNGAAGYLSADSLAKWWAAKDGCPSTPVVTNLPDINTTDGCTVTKYVRAPGQNSSEVILFKITGGGHTWPGAFPIPSAGNTNQDIKASGEIWKFFRNHSMKCVTNSVSENQLTEQIKIYPNPSDGTFTVFSPYFPVRVIVFSIHGEKVFSGTLNSSEEWVDVRKESSGIYIIKFQTEKGISVQKMIKE